MVSSFIIKKIEWHKAFIVLNEQRSQILYIYKFNYYKCKIELVKCIFFSFIALLNFILTCIYINKSTINKYVKYVCIFAANHGYILLKFFLSQPSIYAPSVYQSGLYFILFAMDTVENMLWLTFVRAAFTWLLLIFEKTR